MGVPIGQYSNTQEAAGQEKRVLNYRISEKTGRREEGERGRERERESDYMLVRPSLSWRREV